MATKSARILIVEDATTLAELYKGYLSKSFTNVVTAASGREGLDKIRSSLPDVIVADINLPDMSGLEILDWVQQQKLPVETVVITSNGSVNMAVEAMKRGAFDFVVKPMSPDRLCVTVRNAAEQRRLKNTVSSWKEGFTSDRFCDFIGSSLPMQAVYQVLRSAAQSKATVFVTGESGTGKELCASALHSLSQRSSGPFVAINCAAIPRELLESEIFGHVKGAFTGATQERVGAAMLANGGTLFLDEVGELELSFQAKMLRFLETGLVHRVGESTPREVDVRIVCATNRDPIEEVKAGRFRQDLFYRLHVVPVHLPPLRDREGDIVLLARHFLETFAAEEHKMFSGFTAPAEDALLAYDWPGNIRELRNVIRQIVVLNEGKEIDIANLPCSFRPSGVRAAGSSAVKHDLHQAQNDNIIALETQIEMAIDRAIEMCGGSIPKAAAALKVSPSTLYRRLQSRIGA